jgi:hypothetical protein
MAKTQSSAGASSSPGKLKGSGTAQLTPERLRLLFDRMHAARGLNLPRGITEAVLIGSTVHLEAGDVLSADISSELQHATLPRVRNGSPTVIAPLSSTGAGLELALGAAFVLKLHKPDKIMMTLSATEFVGHYGQIAADHRLPIVFVTTTANVPETRHTDREITKFSVAANDVIAVYRVAQESVLRARNGGYPTVIQCTTDPAVQTHTDSLAHMESYLSAKGLWHK